mmetsp:Transcript_2938/g.6809  ORF Transcript_2938/g.6809 Transcript_2938/m.6809 type:complete len:97 (+) Transcript_2938:1300-1590(+)
MHASKLSIEHSSSSSTTKFSFPPLDLLLPPGLAGKMRLMNLSAEGTANASALLNTQQQARIGINGWITIIRLLLLPSWHRRSSSSLAVRSYSRVGD